MNVDLTTIQGLAILALLQLVDWGLGVLVSLRRSQFTVAYLDATLAHDVLPYLGGLGVLAGLQALAHGHYLGDLDLSTGIFAVIVPLGGARLVVLTGDISNKLQALFGDAAQAVSAAKINPSVGAQVIPLIAAASPAPTTAPATTPPPSDPWHVPPETIADHEQGGMTIFIPAATPPSG